MKFLLVALITSLLALAPLPDAAGPAHAAPRKSGGDELIVPGRSAGHLTLGRPIPAAAYEAYGKPDIVNPADPGPENRDTGNVTWNRLVNVKMHDGRSPDHVFQLYVAGRRFRTREGIRVGSTERAVRKAYRGARRVEETDGDHEYGYALPGIVFYIAGRKVGAIGVHPLEPLEPAPGAPPSPDTESKK